jgi:hypothetical protein
LRWSTMNVMINAVRRSVGLLTMAIAALSAGCGVDGDLTSGFGTGPDAASVSDGTTGTGAEGRAALEDSGHADEGAAAMSDGGTGTSSEGGADSPTSDAGGDGQAQNDAMSGGDGCSMCGGPTANCCAPTHQCVGSGTQCCGNEGATCGGDNGLCCATGATQLACTAARTCAPTCAMSGSCTVPLDCCLGTYCDSTNSCVACLAMNSTCAQPSQCCSGACRNSMCVSE